MASFSDEAVYLHENVVRGHHVYKHVWSPDIGEMLQLLREEDNDRDSFAVPYSVVTLPAEVNSHGAKL